VAVYNLGTAQGKIEIDTNDLKNADIALRGAGTSMIGFGVAALGAFGYVIGVGAQFEKEMSFVQAVTNASEEDMKKLGEAAIELGKKGPFGPRQVAAGFVDLAKAGLSADEIINGVGEAAVNLAAAGDIPFTQSAEVLVNVLRSFNLSAEESTRIIDSIAGAANASTIDISDMATSLKYAAAPAAALGVSVEDVNASLAILGNRGIKGSTAGTALRRVFLNLAAPTAGVTDQLKELGIVAEDGTNKLFDAAGNLKSVPEVFEILGNSMEGFTSQQKVAALNAIFGARAVNSALILMEQGAEGFADINAQISQTNAGDVAAKRMDNLAGAIQRFKAALEATFIEAGSPFQDFLKNIVEIAREVILWFGRLPKGLQTFILSAIAVVGVVSVLAGAFLLTIGNIVRAIRIFGELGKAFKVIKGIMTAVTSGARAMSLAFAANPIVLIVLALIALGVALYMLYTKNKKFREFIDKLWQTIQKIWDAILGFVKKIPEYFTQAWDWVKRKTDEIWDAVYEKVSGVIGGIINFFRELPGKIAGFVANMAQAIAGFAVDVFNSVISFFVNLPGLIGKALSAAISAVIDFAKRLPYYIGFAIGFVIGLTVRFAKLYLKIWWNVVKSIGRFLLRLPGIIIDIFGKILSFVIEWGGKLLAFILDLFLKIVTGVFNFLVSLPGRIFDILVTIMTHFINFGLQLIQLVWDTFLAVVTTIWDFLVGLPGMIWGFIQAAFQTIVDFVPKFFQAAWDIGNSILGGIIDIITGLPGKVWDILWDVIEAFGGLVSAAFNAAKDFAGGLWDGFKSGLGINSPSFIEEAMFSIQDATAAGTRDLRKQVRMMQGLSSGIPALNSGALGLSSPAAAAVASNGGGQIYNQNAPLIGQASIRSDEDIVQLARQLDSLKNDQMAARGRKAVNR